MSNLQIQMDSEALQRAINEKIQAAVEDAIGGYETREAISKTISAEMASGVIGEAVRQAVAEIDTGAMVTALAKEIQRTATAATLAILRDAMVESIMRLRKVSEYDDAKRRVARKEIVAELGL